MQLRRGSRGGEYTVAEPEHGVDRLAAATEAVQYAAAAYIPDEDEAQRVACVWAALTDGHAQIARVTSP